MKVLKYIFDFYIDASIHIAFAVLSLVWISVHFLQITVPLNHFYYFVFFATIPCYNFMKYGVEAKKYLIIHNTYHKYIQVFSFLAFGLAIYHLYYLRIATWYGLAVLLLFVGLYAIPLLPGAKNLRSLAGLKVFIVAGVWACLTVVMPVIEAELDFNWDIGIKTIQRFLIVLVLMVPFEIRDLAYDPPELRTIPQRYGPGMTTFLGGVLTLLFFFFTFFQDLLTYKEVIAKGILFLAFGIMLLETKKHQKKYFSSFGVEAIPIFWALLIKAMDVLWF